MFHAIYQRVMKVSISKIYVKNHEARWASYSSRHNVNFNFKLALPEKIIEYIVIHELAHSLEPSHSRKFWHIVERFCPDYKERRNELAKLSSIVSNEVIELSKKIDEELMNFLDRQLKLRRIADTQENNDGCITTIWTARRSETK